MVSTRSASRPATSDGPDDVPSPTTPPKSVKRRPGRPPASAKVTRRASRSSTTTTTTTTTTAATSPTRRATRRKRAAPTTWQHAPNSLLLAWLAISLPLVVWDTGYVLLRPHTMDGGSLHWPLWVPYRLYGAVDHVYGWKAFRSGSGFTGAVGLMNAVEIAMYLYYLWALCPRSEGSVAAAGRWRAVTGHAGAVAVAVGFAAAVMTLSKTALYCERPPRSSNDTAPTSLPWLLLPRSLLTRSVAAGLHEYYSGFDNIAHNSLARLIFYWIIPNGAWLVGPAYMVWCLGGDIVDGLEAASGHAADD
ncbi:hypothetical protein DCS_03484 [Drechmeria coniospora]|uniref:C6 transcription factor n=1 Tax=Drechmeria coniospora TaxID=98403 RepID=A0A151GHB2_DRECN|nr:hypothetical protein DCS_03484 [Drechmeria coniospora]KYK56484.1 hypothetical protein DCS_03484 [Drechmeria coniospora]